MEDQEYYTDSVYDDSTSLASSQALPEENDEERSSGDASMSRDSPRPRPLPDAPSQNNQPRLVSQRRKKSRIPRPIAGVSSVRQVIKAEPEPIAKSCMATTSAPSSSRSVRFLLPEGHQDSFDDDIEESISPVVRGPYSQADVTMNSLDEDEVDEEEYNSEDLEAPSNGKPRTYAADSGHVINERHIAEQQYIAGQHHVINRDPVADTEAGPDHGEDAYYQNHGDNHRQPQPLPLSMRLGQMPPYPPPEFPPPTPPFPPRLSSKRGIPRTLSHAQLLPQETNQKPVFPSSKSAASLGSDLGYSPTRNIQSRETAQAEPSEPSEPSEPTETSPRSPTGREPVFPSFGSTPTESSGSYSPLQLGPLQINQPIHTLQAGPRAPIYIHPNTTYHSLRAIAVDESERPIVRTTPSGSPVYIRAPNRHLVDRNMPRYNITPTQGPSNPSPNPEGSTGANRENLRSTGEHILHKLPRKENCH
ncbi:hypothetical protein F4776DRAFT_427763 [Hypoxylon sp. NC0597]|nr:hypothetical protein F4776DRAFT_427763 [Hypoxylon sp. NC0597]